MISSTVRRQEHQRTEIDLGSRLIDFAAKLELGGAAEQTFAPDGLTSTIEIPLIQG
jgi:hypothetical protein